MTVTSARLQPGAWQDWLVWARVCLEHGRNDDEYRKSVQSTINMLEADGGELLSFALLTARRNG